MKQHMVIWTYQARLLLRNRQLLLGVSILLLASLFAARYGQHFVDQQNKVIYIVDTTARGQYEQALDWAAGTKEKIAPFNFAFETAVYRPTPMASLAIGQKDNYPFYHEIGLYENIYGVTSTDIQNPVKLLSGNFDLSYVLIYLFPLFIIVFSYNVLSEEKEHGTYTLLKIQGNARHVIMHKLGFRLVVMLLLSLLANLLAFTINGVQWQTSGAGMVAWILISFGYIVFWFALAYFVVSFQKSGAITALALSGFWVLLLLLVPSIIHRNIAKPQEQQQVQSIFNSRGDFNSAYELDSLTLVDSFRKLQHPFPLVAVADTGAKAEEFRFIMLQEVQVRQNNNISKKPMQQQAEEYQETLRWNWINPVFAAQNALNQVAATEINNYHHYLDSVERFQTRKRYLSNNHQLSDLPFSFEDIAGLPRFTYQPVAIGAGKALGLMFPVFVLVLLFTLLGTLKFRDFFRNS